MEERKVLDENGFTITTERFIFGGSEVIPIADIHLCYPFIDRGWPGTLIIGGFGALVAYQGSPGAIFGGLLLMVGAYFFFRLTMTRKLMITTHSGGKLDIDVKDTSFLRRLVDAVEKAEAMRRGSQRDAIRTELDSMPSA